MSRTLFVLAAALLLEGSITWGDVSVSLNIATDLHFVSVGHRSHEQHGTCNMGGGWTENLPTVDQRIGSSAGNGTFQSNGAHSYTIVAGFRPRPQVARNTTVSMGFDKSGIVETVSLSFSEIPLPPAQSPDVGGDCDTDHYTNKVDSPAVNGDIKINYAVPDGVHAVIIRRSLALGSFSLAMRGVKESLFENPEPEGEPRILWVIPNTTISQVFQFDPVNQGALLNGSFSMSFEPIPPENLPHSASALTHELQNQLGLKTNNTQDRMSIIREIISTVAANDNAVKFYSAAETYKLGELAQAEYELSGRPITGPGATNLRIAALLGSFRTSAWILDHLMPFCKQLDLELPIIQQKLKVNGLAYSYFLFQRALLEINSYDSSPYRAMLNHLSEMEQAKKTYQDVTENEVLIKELNDAIKVLRHIPHSALVAPFAQAQEDLKRVYDEFKNLGNGAAAAHVLLTALAQISENERQVSEGIFERLRSFNKDSADYSKFINVNDLVTMLQTLESERRRVAQDLDRNKALFSAAKDSSNDVTDQLTRLVTFNVNIFSHPFNGEAIKLETLREKFISEPWFAGGDTTKSVEKAEACVFLGGST